MSAKRLTPAQWAEIVTLYERGEATQQELSVQFGISRQSIGVGLRDRGVVMGSRISEIKTEVEEIAAEKRLARIKDATEFKNRFSKYNLMLANMVMKKVADAETKGGGALSALNAELTAIRTASQIVKRVREENYVLLDIESLDTVDDEMPELAVSVYSEKELDAIVRANEEAYNEHTDGDETDPDLDDLDV